ncbi:MAG: M18 family aminopeptidase, partial [Firmicutes bacterium]|nr:M18 family aminopeptidase [Bacillota bacterium]
MKKDKYIKELGSFLKEAKTPYHAVSLTAQILTKAGFSELAESDAWQVKPGGRYYVSRNGSSIIAFSVPKSSKLHSFSIVAAHSDSPTFRVKENAELAVAGQYVKLNTEGYGGAILSTWLDRPLGIAGRVFVEEGGRITEKLVDLDTTVVIPNLAIHMNREINDGYKWNKQVDLLPLFGGSEAAGSFDEAVIAKAGAGKNGLLGKDLVLYCTEELKVWGPKGEFCSAPRLDDLASAFAGLSAITENPVSADAVNVLAIFDNEEVGSLTAQGADSTFLYDVLQRIRIAMKASEEDYYRAVAESFLISADNAHAVHPNHAEKSDENNRPYLNGGFVVKYSANQKYTTSGKSAAYLKKL